MRRNNNNNNNINIISYGIKLILKIILNAIFFYAGIAFPQT